MSTFTDLLLNLGQFGEKDSVNWDTNIGILQNESIFRQSQTKNVILMNRGDPKVTLAS